MNPIQHEAELLELANDLLEEKIPQFDLRYWVRGYGDCGTVYCAFGWYMKKHPEYFINPRYPCIELPNGDILTDFTAVAYHFGIPVAHAEYLFSEYSYDYKTQVAVGQRIRWYVYMVNKGESI